ncbi:MAG: hypothetical protein ABJE95_13860 [Byssovorax sp.]
MTIPDGDPLAGLSLPGSSFVIDPGLAGIVEVDHDSVALHQSTSDPNRVTIHVPTEKTVLSLGAASGPWKTDIGITGYTDNHIHFETKVNDKTIVSLGGPATTAAINGHDAKVPTKSEGYAMVTAERAWHESDGQHYLLSRTQDISMLTLGPDKRAVIQADKGYVDVNGGQEVNLCGGGVAIGAAAKFPIEDVLYDKSFKGDAPSSVSATVAGAGMNTIAAVFAAYDLGLAAVKTAKSQKAGTLVKNEYFYSDVVKWVLDAVNFKLAVGSLIDTYTSAPSPPGCVKLSGEQHVVGLAGKGASFVGARSASLTSTLVASVSAGMTASMKGTLWAGVGGLLTTLRAQKKLEVSSTYGDVIISGKKNVELTSNDEFIAASEDDAQVTGKNHLLFGAGKHAFIGAEPGWGAIFFAKGIAFGKASGLANLKQGKIAKTPAIRIDSGKIEIVRESVAVTLTDDMCLIEAPGIRFDSKAKNVTFNGKMAVLD